MSYKNKISLNKKKVFLLGAGLIGKEICKALLEFEAEVLVLDKSKELNLDDLNLTDDEKLRTNFSHFDLSQTKSIEEKTESLFTDYFIPDIFINSSYPTTKDWSQSNFEDIALESLEKNISYQLTNSFWVSKIVAEKLRKESLGGSLVFLNSIYGLLGQDLSIYEGTSMKENAAYSIIKGGLTNITRQMGSYYGRYGIRVNSVCSGGVSGHVKGSEKKQSSKFKDNYSRKTPLKRLANPDEIASAVLFLSSDLSSYITGSNLIVDGGWSII